jgi:hypothetical protein
MPQSRATDRVYQCASGTPRDWSAERRRSVRGGSTGEPSRSQLTTLIHATYREIPGLSLRIHQAARMFGLRETTCQIILDDLVRDGGLPAHRGRGVPPALIGRRPRTRVRRAESGPLRPPAHGPSQPICDSAASWLVPCLVLVLSGPKPPPVASPLHTAIARIRVVVVPINTLRTSIGVRRTRSVNPCITTSKS